MNELIYGKKGFKNIVSMEPKDNTVQIFYEQFPGKITSDTHQCKSWLLSSTKLSENFQRLKGNLHYKFGRLYDNREDFLKARNFYKHKDIFSIYNSKEACMIKEGYSNFLGMKPEDVSLLSFDLETTGLDPHAPDAKILLISCAYRAGNKLEQKLFAYDEVYGGQQGLIEKFCDYVREKNPSLIIGHNIFSFDLPYLKRIAELYGTSLKMGRDNSNVVFNKYESDFRVDGSRDLHYHGCNIYGREIVDSLFLAVKSDIGRKYNSYGLKPIIEQEGWTLPNRTFYDSSQIRHNYQDPIEWEKIKAYCMDDSLDAITLYDKFIPPFFYMAQNIPKSFQGVMTSATGSQLNSIMLRAYLQDAHSLPKADEPYHFEGAISLGNPGIYYNFMKLDVSSLYPSIMVMDNIYPEHKDPKGYFPQITRYLREERLKNKKLAKETGEEYYSHLEQSQKIAINSLYGFMGAPGLLFNHIPGAAEVTRKGREILTQGMNYVTSSRFTIANVDTDSILFGRTDFSDITRSEREQIRQGMNNLFTENISWEDDGYFPTVIIAKKKNYVLQDEKGKIKYKGSSLKDPKLEPALREFLKRIIDCILEKKTNYTEIYLEYVQEIQNVKDIKRWCSRKTISEKTLTNTRTNESRIREAFEDSEYVEGDRIYVFNETKEKLVLAENFNGTYDKTILLQKLFKASKRFETVLDCKSVFINYSLKRSQKLLEDLVVYQENHFSS